MKLPQIYPEGVPDEHLRGFHVAGVRDNGKECWQVSDEDADFFAVYTIDGEGLLSVIADIPDRKTADDLKSLLSVVLARHPRRPPFYNEYPKPEPPALKYPK